MLIKRLRASQVFRKRRTVTKKRYQSRNNLPYSEENFKRIYQNKLRSAEDALSSFIHDESKIFIHTACAAPQHLMRGLATLGKCRRNIDVYHMHVNGDAPYMSNELQEVFNVNPMFYGPNERAAQKRGRKNLNYVPIFLSDAPALFERENGVKIDTALIQVSPPDRHGFCSLGISIDCTASAVRNAKFIIAQVNPKFPRTHGEGFIHISNINAIVEHEEELHTLSDSKPSKEEEKIAEFIAHQVPNKACLQLGVGRIPNAVCSALSGHKELGVHTEMFSDGVMRLYKNGNITNRHKKVHNNEILTSFIMGSQELYDFVDDNPVVIFRESSYTNNVSVVAQNDNMVAINSCLEIDLTGQICADSIGPQHYSGVGGQLDFMKGAAQSKGGLPIMALPSTTEKRDKDGKIISKIAPLLKEGAGVVTTRAHVHYVVTEYGMVNLFGKNLSERAKLLISISHPEAREYLSFQASKRFNW